MSKEYYRKKIIDLRADLAKEKEENAKIKAEAKAKKIARDQKKRAEKQANESNPIIKRTIKE